jgi:hypothetical protein
MAVARLITQALAIVLKSQQTTKLKMKIGMTKISIKKDNKTKISIKKDNNTKISIKKDNKTNVSNLYIKLYSR